MSDAVLSRFLASGTNAERLAFTPDPAPINPAHPDQTYIWHETDTLDTYAWDRDGAVWNLVGSGSGGLADGDYGDITVGGSGTTLTIDNGVLDVANFDGAAIVTEGEGLASSDNDTSLPTTAAVKDYVDTEIAGVGGSSATSALFEDQKPANINGGASTSGSWIARTLNTEVYDDIGLALHSATVTITIATPGVITWTGHGLILNSTVIFTTTGALPTGLTAGTTYYVISTGLTANDFQVSASPGGAAINTSGSQSGTHTATASVLSLAAGDYEVEAKSVFFSCLISRIRLRDITNSTTLALSLNVYGSTSGAGHAVPQISGRFTLAGTAKVELQYRIGSSTSSNGLGVLSNFGETEVYSSLKLTKTA